MTRRPALKAVTANDLRGGHVVWRTASGRWSQHLADAHLWDDEAAAQIELIDAARETAEVVGVYLADIAQGPHGPEPVHFRERFRADGRSLAATRSYAPQLH